MGKTVMYLEPGDTYIWRELPRDDQDQIEKYVKAAPIDSAIRIFIYHYGCCPVNTFRVAEMQRMPGDDFSRSVSMGKKPVGFFPKNDFKVLFEEEKA